MSEVARKLLDLLPTAAAASASFRKAAKTMLLKDQPELDWPRGAQEKALVQALMQAALQPLLQALEDEKKLKRKAAEAIDAAVQPLKQKKAKTAAKTKATSQKARERQPPKLDPLKLIFKGEPQLRRTLAALDLDDLRDIVTGHAMDPKGNVRKWKSAAKLIDHIVSEAGRRRDHGTAFL